MKKKISIILCLLCLVFVYADSIGTSVDLGFIQDFAIKSYTYQFSADARYRFSNGFELRSPITVSIARDAQLFDTGLYLHYYPWQKHGLFLGLSLVQFGFVKGDANLDKNIYSLNEVNLGWTFSIGKGLLIEPSLSIRDPSGTYTDEYEMIKGSFPCNRKFRFKLSAGWSFNI